MMSKRLLSPSNIDPTENPDDKRSRNASLDIDEIDPTQLGKMELDKEPMMSDLKKSMDTILAQLSLTALSEDLKKVASRTDLKEMDNRLLAQSQEIGQLREEMKSLRGNFESLQSNVDRQIAANLASGAGSLSGDPGNITPNMAAGEVNSRQNLVFEALTGDSDAEIISEFIKTASAICVTVYSQEIEQVVRMSRRNDANKKPGPVLQTLSRIILRDTILRKKGDLMKVPGYDKVFINVDEPLEIRKAKSFMQGSLVR